MANAGATGVVLDILCQAPRHHPAWRALSTAGAGLLAVLVRCEGSTEAAQPQALRMLLVVLESEHTCGPARQAVATVLHCIVAQRTVHRDKLLAAGALPVMLRVLRRLDVLCDLVAVQELLWTLVYLTDEEAMEVDPAAAEIHSAVADHLAPLLFLYGMPWHSQHGHMAALAIRALHVQVAGYDVGKDTLRAAGTLSVLVDLVRRHSAPYVAAATSGPAGRTGRTRSIARTSVGSTAAAESGPHDARAGSDGARGQPEQGHQGLGGSGAVGRPNGSGSAGAQAGTGDAYVVASVRPPAHQGCDIHAACGKLFNGDPGGHAHAALGPYGSEPLAALVSLTPWQRLMAVLLIQGIVPGLAPAGRRRGAGHAAAAASRDRLREAADGDEDSGTPSVITTDDGQGPDWALGADGRDTDEAGEITAADEAGMSGPHVDTVGGVAARVSLEGPAAGASTSGWARHGWTPGREPVVDGARLACYGLLLPLLADSEGVPGGAGAAAAAVAGVMLRRRLCPLRESLATLKTLLCDCEANQLLAAELGLVPLLVQLVAHGDMGLAWQAAEAAVYLSGGATGAALVSAGAAEEMAYLLQESAEALHGLTLRKQIQVQSNTMGAGGGAGEAASRPTGIQRSLSGSGRSGTGPAPGPAPLPAVHVRPLAATQTGRPQRVFLVGRLPLDFTTSGSCFYGSHDAASYCDYCTPSAAIKVLLRLMSATATATTAANATAGGSALEGPPGSPPGAGASVRALGAEAAVCRRFAAAGGLYGVLLLLHHEGAGVHHSKLAASLLTLLDLVVANTPGAQDDLRAAGGLGVLTTLLWSLMRPGVMDVYQLRVATCRTLCLALQGNPANKLAAREQGLLPLLVSLLTVLAGQRKSRSDEVVVDDTGPLTMACLEALAAGARDSPGTQESLIALGVMHPVCDLLKDERLDVEVRTAAVRTLTALVDACPVGQSGALALDAVPVAVSWLDRWRMGHGSSTPAPSVPAERDAEPAVALAGFLAGMLSGNGKTHAKAAIVGAGAIPVLVYLLRTAAVTSANGGAASASASAAGGAEAAAGGVASAVAADVLSALVEGDTDLQNELVAQGVLTAAVEIIRRGAAAAPQTLRLLTVVLRSNTFVKNTARHTGLAEALVAAVRRCGLAHSAGSAAAAGALTEMAAGNHANQDAVAVQGGLEVAVDLVRDGFAALPLRVLAGEGGVLSGDSGSSGAESSEEEGEQGSGDEDGDGGSSGAGPGPGSEAAAALAEAGRRRRDRRRCSRASGEDPWLTTAVETVAAGSALSRLLQALFKLVAACVELNGGNKEYVRELGGVALFGEFLLAATDALMAPALQRPGRSSRRGRGQPHTPLAQVRLRETVTAARVALSASVAAACGAVAALVRESGANLARLEEQPGLSLALFKLLVASDAPTSAAAALAIEWLVLRTPTHLTAPSREAFEADLVDVLAMALYVPYAPVLVVPSPAAAAAAQDLLGVAAAPRQQRQEQLAAMAQHGPWHAAVTALMPPSGLSAEDVRDAAAVLMAVADVADGLDAQQYHQQQGTPQLQQQGGQPGAGRAGAAGGSAAGGRAKPLAGWAPAVTQVALPRLRTIPSDSVASDHISGLALSSTLAGSGASGGPGNQTWWAELAGRAAAAFQKVANGALQGAAGAASGAGAAGGTAAGAAAGAGPAAALQQGSGQPGSGPRGGSAGAGSSAGGEVSAAAMERRRQVAWMLFLLAAKSPEHRAHLRRLVRTSLTPLAQQLANAEACRAQLEAAALAAVEVGPSPAAGGAAAPAGLAGVSSAVLESASSTRGRLPVSTGALEIGAAEGQGTRTSHRSSAAPAFVPLTPTVALPAMQQPAGSYDNPQQQQQQQQYLQHQHQVPGLGGPVSSLPVGALPPSEALQPGSLLPQPNNRARSTPSGGAPAMYTGYNPSGGLQPSVLYGNVAPPPPPPVNYSAAPQEASAAHAGSDVHGFNSTPTPAAATDRFFSRLSRTASGSVAVPASISVQGSGGSGSAIASGSGGSGGARPLPKRGSLSGAAAVPFAPFPGSTSAGRSRAASPALGYRGGPQQQHSADLGGRGFSGGSGVLAAQQLQQHASGPAPASQRALHAQVSAGGSSGIMSDDDELAMIQQEVALLANTTSTLTWNGAGGSGGPASGGVPGSVARGGYQSGGSGGSPAASPLRWGPGRR